MKKLSRNEMKKLIGGVQAGGGKRCTASATCPNGHTYTCTGETTTWGGDGSTVGCNGQDGSGVTCYYSEGGVIHSSSYNCTGGISFT